MFISNVAKARVDVAERLSFDRNAFVISMDSETFSSLMSESWIQLDL